MVKSSYLHILLVLDVDKTPFKLKSIWVVAFKGFLWNQ